MDGLCPIANKLFNALEQCNDDRVLHLCRNNEHGGLRVCSIHDATVLHLAISNKKFGLADKLLDDLMGKKECAQKLLDCVDAWGNTLLHCAAVSNDVDLARRFYDIAPDMLLKRNNWGETAFFQACRYANFEIFEYLDEKANECAQKDASLDMDLFLKRDDNMNVLHVSIVMRAFDIAISIVKKYPKLCKERPQKDMNAFQVLASSPMVFRSKLQLGFFDQIIYKCVPTCTNDVVNTDNEGSINTKINKMKRLKKDHKLVSQLTKILSEKEDFWRGTYPPRSHDIDTVQNEKQAKDDDDNNSKKKITELKLETALQMAVKNGITEIVEQILKTCPQAVEQYNKERQNLLHIAIRYRQMEVFDFLRENYALSFEWLIRNIDVHGDTILHMVGYEIEKDIKDKDTNPVKRLSEGLKLLTRLKKICPSILSNHINNDMMTADDITSHN